MTRLSQQLRLSQTAAKQQIYDHATTGRNNFQKPRAL